MADVKKNTHEFPALVFQNSTILILGSFPSVLSRAQSFYYGHPRNRFWRVLAGCYQDDMPLTVDEKKSFCKLHHIALYDVIEECEIAGSADSTIKNPKPSDVFSLCRSAPIKKVILNGKKATELFHKFHLDFSKTFSRIEVLSLPSTSPANAAVSFGDLLAVWSKALQFNGE